MADFKLKCPDCNVRLRRVKTVDWHLEIKHIKWLYSCRRCGNPSFRAGGEQLHRVAVLKLKITVDLVQIRPGQALLDQANMVAVKFRNVAGLPGQIDRFLVPAGVDDPQPRPFQCQGKTGEEVCDLPAGFVVVKHFLMDDGSLEKKFLAEEPVIVVFCVAEQEIQVVVAQDALGQTVLDEPLDEGDHGGVVRATVSEVAHEDEPSPLGVLAVLLVAEAGQEIVEGLDLADDIDGAFEQGTDEGHGGVPDGGRWSALVAWVRGNSTSDSPFFVWEMPGCSRRTAWRCADRKNCPLH